MQWTGRYLTDERSGLQWLVTRDRQKTTEREDLILNTAHGGTHAPSIAVEATPDPDREKEEGVLEVAHEVHHMTNVEEDVDHDHVVRRVHRAALVHDQL